MDQTVTTPAKPAAERTDLGYRGWERSLRPTAMAWWPVARTSLLLLLRRKLFWILLLIGLFNFLFIFAMIYLYAEFIVNLPDSPGSSHRFKQFAEFILPGIIEGDGKVYSRFINIQGIVSVLMLAFGGAVLVGSDHRQGGLIFYLSRRLGVWQYLLGKFVGIAMLVSLVTTVPALILYVEYGMLTEFRYFSLTYRTILVGILGYGMAVTVTLSLLCLAMGSWLHRTVASVMSWGTLFVLLPLVAEALQVTFSRIFAGGGRGWLLLVIWQDLSLVGDWCFGDLNSYDIHFWLACLILLCICGLSIFLCFWKLRTIRVVS